MRFYVAAGGDGMKAAVGEFFLLQTFDRIG